jgi:hypothetical protein
MLRNIMIDYTAFYLLVVVVSAAIGAIGCLLLTDRRRDRAELAADITAADAAPVPPRIMGRVLVGRLDDPYPQPALEAPPDDESALVSTGELHWVRQQLALDDFALDLEQHFFELREQIREQFRAIRIPA